MNLTPDLEKIKQEIEMYAINFGLDFYPVFFEVLDWNELNATASLGGFPSRYPHWRFGMEYEDLSKRYAWGLSKIYEMVINNDPCYAYLLYANSTVDQKLVMAHVYAHCDFFKNNVYFSHTSRKMMDEMGNHRTRIMRYVNQYGHDVVEDFIDACLSIDTLIDCHSPAIRRVRDHPVSIANGGGDERIVKKLKSTKTYMDKFINPPEFLHNQAHKLEEDQKLERKFPESPERDVMGFIMEFAHLDKWQRDVLSMMREEAYYFMPQGQTKIMNEGWACVSGDTLVFTGDGVISAKEIVDKNLKTIVSDGEKERMIYDWARFESRETVTIRTRRGMKLLGSVTHQILMDDRSWKRLDHLSVGDKISISCGMDLWSKKYQKINWVPYCDNYVSLRGHELCEWPKQSPINNSLQGIASPQEGLAMTQRSYQRKFVSVSIADQLPKVFDEKLATLVGYYLGDDQLIHSKYLTDLLRSIGLKTGVSARFKDIPSIILRSPKPVVRAFLRAYYDCDGYAGPCGVILSTASESMSLHVQQLLLNFGIISSRRRQKHDIWNVQTMGRSAKIFMDEIGFGLERKQKRLREYVKNRKWFKKEEHSDEIVSIEAGQQDVYDFSVSETHCYCAAGFINHNSYWHSKIMTTKALKDSELIDYADHHSGTMATYPGRLNPYKMGLELFKSIEERWNKGKFGKEYDECENMVEKVRWDKKLGLGREKIFEVRKIYSDITFIDEFLTPEFCKEQKLFTYAYNQSADQYEIATREFAKVKEKLLFQLTNFGHPIIAVVDGNYKNRGELLLKHQHEGVDLRADYSQETLKNLYKVWCRPVNIETIIEDVPKVLSFDGEEYKELRP